MVISVENRFSTHVFCAPAEGVPLEFGIGIRGKNTRMMGRPDQKKEVWRYLQQDC